MESSTTEQKAPIPEGVRRIVVHSNPNPNADIERRALRGILAPGQNRAARQREFWLHDSEYLASPRCRGQDIREGGVYYGRVAPAEAWSVVAAALERRVHIPCYRGRSCHGFAAQAAELAVRGATGLEGLDDVLVRSVTREGAGWEAEVAAAGRLYDVGVRVEEGEPTHLTCSTTRLSRPKRYVAGSPRARAA